MIAMLHEERMYPCSKTVPATEPETSGYPSGSNQGSTGDCSTPAILCTSGLTWLVRTWMASCTVFDSVVATLASPRASFALVLTSIR